MASLYEINNNLVNIFNEIESNDGEVNDELYNRLTITQDELIDKLDDYIKAIKSWKADADALKAEKVALNCRQNIYKNRVERLKKCIAVAINNFGNQGKNNKFIELRDCRVFTKNSITTEIDIDRCNYFIKLLTDYIKELYANGCLYIGNDFDETGILNAINNIALSEKGSDFEIFTLDDFNSIIINVNIPVSIDKLFSSKENIATLIAKENITCEVDEDKNYYKTILEEDSNDSITIAKLVNNQSVVIK